MSTVVLASHYTRIIIIVDDACFHHFEVSWLRKISPVKQNMIFLRFESQHPQLAPHQVETWEHLSRAMLSIQAITSAESPTFRARWMNPAQGFRRTPWHLSPCLENNEGGRRIGRSLNVVCKRRATHCSDVDHAFWILLNSFDIPKEGRKFARGRMLMAFRCFQMLHLSKVNFHLWPPGPLVTTVSYSFTRKDWNLKRPVG